MSTNNFSTNTIAQLRYMLDECIDELSDVAATFMTTEKPDPELLTKLRILKQTIRELRVELLNKQRKTK